MNVCICVCVCVFMYAFEYFFTLGWAFRLIVGLNGCVLLVQSCPD